MIENVISLLLRDDRVNKQWLNRGILQFNTITRMIHLYLFSQLTQMTMYSSYTMIQSPTAPTVQSVSKDLVVTGFRIEEAPGAAVADETGTRNSEMFIIETTANDPYVQPSNLFR